jgi:hypothetical protein
MSTTLEEFRSMPGYAQWRKEIRDFLDTDAGKIAMRVLRERGRPHDVPSAGDALASARVLSQFHGYNAALDDFELLSEPLIVGPELESTFRADETDHLPRQ